jgi:hypothetical protein
MFTYLCGNAIFVTWLLAALYHIKLTLQDKSASKKTIILQTAIGVIAAAFQLFFILFVGGMLFLTMFIVYLPAFALYIATKYIKARKLAVSTQSSSSRVLGKAEKAPISILEWIFMGVISAIGIISVILVATGTVDIFWVVGA